MVISRLSSQLQISVTTAYSFYFERVEPHNSLYKEWAAPVHCKFENVTRLPFLHCFILMMWLSLICYFTKYVQYPFCCLHTSIVYLGMYNMRTFVYWYICSFMWLTFCYTTILWALPVCFSGPSQAAKTFLSQGTFLWKENKTTLNWSEWTLEGIQNKFGLQKCFTCWSVNCLLALLWWWKDPTAAFTLSKFILMFTVYWSIHNCNTKVVKKVLNTVCCLYCCIGVVSVEID